MFLSTLSSSEKILQQITVQDQIYYMGQKLNFEKIKKETTQHFFKKIENDNNINNSDKNKNLIQDLQNQKNPYNYQEESNGKNNKSVSKMMKQQIKISEELMKEVDKNCQKILQSFVQSTIWITYRKNFQKIDLKPHSSIFNLYGMINSKLNSDTHWGCMLRCGQNIWAETLKRHMARKIKIQSRKKQDKIINNNSSFSPNKIRYQDANNNNCNNPEKNNNYQQIQPSFDYDDFKSEILSISNINTCEFIQQQKQQQQQKEEEKQNDNDNINLQKNQGSNKQQEFLQTEGYEHIFRPSSHIQQQNSNHESFLNHQQQLENKKFQKILDHFEQEIIESFADNLFKIQDLDQNPDMKIENLESNNEFTLSTIKNIQQENKLFDHYGAQYSIQRICQESYKQFKMCPGEWYQPNRIMYILQELHHRYPYQNAADLRVFTINGDQQISYLNMLQEMCEDKNITLCENKDHQAYKYNQNNQIKQLVCSKCHNGKKSLAAFISARIGLDKCQQEFLPQLFKLINCKFSVGITGGKGDNAHYFIGSINDDKLIYLDPHTTQQAMTQENKKDKKIQETYKYNGFKILPISKINTSLCFGFYLQNLEDLQQFYEYIEQQFVKKEFFLSFTDKYINYDYEYQPQDNDNIMNLDDDQENEDDYQVIA